MDKKYTAADEHVAGVSEDVLAYPRTIGVADALWALITAQSQEVQEIIAERIDALRSNPKPAPFAAYRMYHTREAINKRFDEFEDTMIGGKAQWCSESEVDSWISGLA
ncbi:MAG: hypothetical protein Q4D23_08235 [Bacteroidales bacterium]|nr:hypothetical protein [Bacteroidales bacterium]